MSTVRTRAKEQLPQVLLTLMSIIQALALEFLWDDVRVAERALRWDAVSTWFQIVADMLGIVQVWLLYTSATMRVRWTPSMRDLIIPFLIGILEFILIDLTGPDHRGLWFLTLATVYIVASWDAQSVFSRARQDPDNVEFFSRFRPPTRLDRFEPPFIIGTLIGFGLVAEFIDDPPELVLAGLTFACAVLIYRMEIARRFWDRSMSIEPLVDDERASG
ncbi:MAG TPA: hypothetical protein VL379_03535 [Pseudomonadales bacterium]|nr:hypothetical protein [Pseudomonadales bacterium]